MLQSDMEDMLRSENFQLKNEITDLKNAFNLNRDILKIVTGYNPVTDPQRHLLLQIITRLTTVNNQAMLNAIELIQEKNVLKQENLRLNLQNKDLEDKLVIEIERNSINTVPTEGKTLIQEQINSLNRELMAANQERITQEHEIEYWRDKFRGLQQQFKEMGPRTVEKQMAREKSKIRRKYTSIEPFKNDVVNQQLSKEIRRLKRHIEQLENRLIVMIKASQVELQSLQPRHERERNNIFFEAEREQIRLLKYALNDINVERKNEEYVLTITERYKEKDVMNNTIVRHHHGHSWPKYRKPEWDAGQGWSKEREWEEKAETRMTEQEY